MRSSFLATGICNTLSSVSRATREGNYASVLSLCIQLSSLTPIELWLSKPTLTSKVTFMMHV